MQNEVFHPFEIAAAAGVPLEQVIAAVGARNVYLPIKLRFFWDEGWPGSPP